MYDYLKKPADMTGFNLTRGTTDFGNLAQFNMYERGYGLLVVISIPKFLEKLADRDAEVAKYVNNYKHILEHDFRSLSGFENLQSDTLDVTDGISTINVIGKVTDMDATQFSMTYQERAGSVITRTHEMFLRGIRDPRGMQAKHYHGLIADGTLEAGFENETFSFLYINTDNTMRQIEKAYYIIGAQPTEANNSMYEYEKGDVQFQEVTVSFNGFPITSNEVNKMAKKYLDWMHSDKNPFKLQLDSSEFKYTGVEKLNPPEGK